MSGNIETVAVLGASPKPERYSNKAIRLLREYGHTVIPITPNQGPIEGLDVVHSLKDIEDDIDTLTLYVSAGISSELTEQIVDLGPGRVIFNPGAENPHLQDTLKTEGIATEEACTLVLLRTNQF